jgi:hypothetical protein
MHANKACKQVLHVRLYGKVCTPCGCVMVTILHHHLHHHLSRQLLHICDAHTMLVVLGACVILLRACVFTSAGGVHGAVIDLS